MADDQYSDQESTSSSTTPPDDIKRRSWLSHIPSSIETTPCSHRSSFSSTFSAATTTVLPQQQPTTPSFASPKPHKSNNPLWDTMRRLRHEIKSRGGRDVGLEHFKLVKRVGSGDLGSVYLCQIRGICSSSNNNNNNNNNKSLYAMKVVDREALAARNKLGRAEVEREILCMLDHPFLPTLYAEFDASHYSCLVMEFCPGGDLYSARLKQPSKRFSVSSTKFYAAEVLLALEYLHMMGIIYRDLKPENVLVREDGHIMLSDFDLCLRCNDVVPKLLRRRFSTSSTTTRSSCASSPPPQPPVQQQQQQDFTRSCAGPLRPVLTSCFSLRRRKLSSTTTTITEHAHHDDTSSTVTHARGGGGGSSIRHSTHGGHESEESESDSEHYPESVSSSVMYQRWATEMVAEPIEARSKSFVGTHEYLAPEVISGQGHGSAVDWWTFGVFLYEMLFGVTPFKGENNERTLRNILKQPLTFPPTPPPSRRRHDHDHRHHHHHHHYTASNREEDERELEKVKDLIRKLLVKNPKRRIGSVKGSVEIKKHEFFHGVNWALIRSVKPPVIPSSEKLNNTTISTTTTTCHEKTVSERDLDQRKMAVMMMMKKKMNHHHPHHHNVGSGNSTPARLAAGLSSGLSFVLPRVLSRKERDQPYQIPFRYDHHTPGGGAERMNRNRNRNLNVNGNGNVQHQQHHRTTRRDEQQQHFEYF